MIKQVLRLNTVANKGKYADNFPVLFRLDDLTELVLSFLFQRHSIILPVHFFPVRMGNVLCRFFQDIFSKKTTPFCLNYYYHILKTKNHTKKAVKKHGFLNFINFLNEESCLTCLLVLLTHQQHLGLHNYLLQVLQFGFAMFVSFQSEHLFFLLLFLLLGY